MKGRCIYGDTLLFGGFVVFQFPQVFTQSADFSRFPSIAAYSHKDDDEDFW